MHDVLRKRLWRKLEALPDDQLYQVLDFIEFLEAKYAPGKAVEPSGLQRFAERVEDGMRIRSVAPKVMGGALGLLGTASRMLDGVADAGRELLESVTGSTGASDKVPPESAEPVTPRQPRSLPPARGETDTPAASGS